ncbi:unnamed protein product [Cylindrotheca closterium]|uniref:DUF6824 domain-containing protein n=1 Tax=Cylindrotheca closterium TaxID=2856 RepID=A0AAD2PY57_9STRA|nr:unnamed protein product [Cylindrotheca closterium]
MTRNYRYKSKPSIHDSRLGPYDILCGRTSHAYNNVGNRRFRVTIRMYLLRYQRLQLRADRKIFIFYLTKLFREEIGFRFLKMEAGDFHDIGEVETRKKIGHALLDQTVKHPIQEATPTPAASSCSPPVLLRKVTDVQKKKPLRSILKAPPVSIQSQLMGSSSSLASSSSSSMTEDQQVRRVSLPLSEPSPYHKILPMPSRVQGVSKKTIATYPPPMKTKQCVTKLESEICMLLVGMNKQNDLPPNQQRCAV